MEVVPRAWLEALLTFYAAAASYLLRSGARAGRLAKGKIRVRIHESPHVIIGSRWVRVPLSSDANRATISFFFRLAFRGFVGNCPFLPPEKLSLNP